MFGMRRETILLTRATRPKSEESRQILSAGSRFTPQIPKTGNRYKQHTLNFPPNRFLDWRSAITAKIHGAIAQPPERPPQSRRRIRHTQHTQTNTHGPSSVTLPPPSCNLRGWTYQSLPQG